MINFSLSRFIYLFLIQQLDTQIINTYMKLNIVTEMIILDQIDQKREGLA